MYVVVSYDIHDDKRRNHIHKALKNYGVWIQYSVFECDLTKEQLLRMQHKLKPLIKESDQDSIRFYHLCDTCNGVSADLLYGFGRVIVQSFRIRGLPLS